MKPIPSTLIILFFFLSINVFSQNQQDSTSPAKSDTTYVIKTFSGGEFIGTILTNNSKVVIMLTEKTGEVEIPKYQIEEMHVVEDKNLSKKGEYVPDQVFSTRYFISTNGLPIEKGESYVLYSLWGPDVNFGIADNLSVGVMTTWIGFPVIGSVKYSVKLDEKNNIGLGLLAGHSLWYSGLANFGLMLPFANYTYGTRRSNINVSAGYGGVWVEGESGGAAIFSVAGITHISRNVSFVFDSWIMPDIDGSNFMAFMPGFRFQNKDKGAFQFAITAVVVDGDVVPAGIPFVQWFRRF